MADKKPTKKTSVVPVEDVDKEPAVTKEKVVPVAEQKKSWSVDSLFWGLLFITIGGLLLLGNMGVIKLELAELWRLWPLLIIAAGFSLLSTRNVAWKVLSVVFVLIALAAVVVVGTGQYDPSGKPLGTQQTTVLTDSGVESAEVTIRAGASSLDIKTADTEEIVDAKLSSDSLQLIKKTERDGSLQKVEIGSESESGWWMNPGENQWDVVLTEKMPLKLTVDAGASSTDADLSAARVRELKVKAGASSTVVTLGSKERDVKGDIEAGASSFTLRVPKTSGISLRYEGGLSSKSIGDLAEIGEGRFQSTNYEAAPNKIEIRVDAGLASFNLERY